MTTTKARKNRHKKKPAPAPPRHPVQNAAQSTSAAPPTPPPTSTERSYHVQPRTPAPLRIHTPPTPQATPQTSAKRSPAPSSPLARKSAPAGNISAENRAGTGQSSEGLPAGVDYSYLQNAGARERKKKGAASNDGYISVTLRVTSMDEMDGLPPRYIPAAILNHNERFSGEYINIDGKKTKRVVNVPKSTSRLALPFRSIAGARQTKSYGSGTTLSGGDQIMSVVHPVQLAQMKPVDWEAQDKKIGMEWPGSGKAGDGRYGWWPEKHKREVDWNCESLSDFGEEQKADPEGGKEAEKEPKCRGDLRQGIPTPKQPEEYKNFCWAIQAASAENKMITAIMPAEEYNAGTLRPEHVTWTPMGTVLPPNPDGEREAYEMRSNAYGGASMVPTEHEKVNMEDWDAEKHKARWEWHRRELEGKGVVKGGGGGQKVLHTGDKQKASSIGWEQKDLGAVTVQSVRPPPQSSAAVNSASESPKIPLPPVKPLQEHKQVSQPTNQVTSTSTTPSPFTIATQKINSAEHTGGNLWNQSCSCVACTDARKDQLQNCKVDENVPDPISRRISPLPAQRPAKKPLRAEMAPEDARVAIRDLIPQPQSRKKETAPRLAHGSYSGKKQNIEGAVDPEKWPYHVLTVLTSEEMDLLTDLYHKYYAWQCPMIEAWWIVDSPFLLAVMCCIGGQVSKAVGNTVSEAKLREIDRMVADYLFVGWEDASEALWDAGGEPGGQREKCECDYCKAGKLEIKKGAIGDDYVQAVKKDFPDAYSRRFTFSHEDVQAMILVDVHLMPKMKRLAGDIEVIEKAGRMAAVSGIHEAEHKHYSSWPEQKKWVKRKGSECMCSVGLVAGMLGEWGDFDDLVDDVLPGVKESYAELQDVYTRLYLSIGQLRSHILPLNLRSFISHLHDTSRKHSSAQGLLHELAIVNLEVLYAKETASRNLATIAEENRHEAAEIIQGRGDPARLRLLSTRAIGVMAGYERKTHSAWEGFVSSQVTRARPLEGRAYQGQAIFYKAIVQEEHYRLSSELQEEYLGLLKELPGKRLRVMMDMSGLQTMAFGHLTRILGQGHAWFLSESRWDKVLEKALETMRRVVDPLCLPLARLIILSYNHSWYFYRITRRPEYGEKMAKAEKWVREQLRRDRNRWVDIEANLRVKGE